MISKYFDVVRATDTPDNYLSIGYDIDVIEHQYETVPSDKPSKLVSLEKGDILVGTVKQQVALFAGDFEAYAQQGWKVLRLKDGADINVVGVFALMNTQRFNYLLRGAYRGESASNLIIGEFTGIELEIKYINPSVAKDFMLQIRLRKLIERRIYLMKELKKGMMQRMFPKNGSKITELRFEGFADDWVKCELSEQKDVRDGTHDSPKYYNSGYPLVTSKNLSEFGLDMSEVSLISNEDFENINKRSKVDVGDIIFGMIGTIGNPVLLEQDGFAIKNVALIKNGGNVLNIWLIQLLKSTVFEKYIQDKISGNTQKFMGLSTIRHYKFFAPTIDEQTKIGYLFNSLDNLIAVNERELDLLEEHKKGYLQKKFL